MNTLRTGMLLAALTAIFVGVGFMIGGSGGAIFAFLLAAGMNVFAYWNSDKMVLRLYGAEEVDASSGGEYYAIVAGLVRKAGLPMPRVYVMHNPQPNAFATGRSPANAASRCSTTETITCPRPSVVRRLVPVTKSTVAGNWVFGPRSVRTKTSPVCGGAGKKCRVTLAPVK